MISHFHNECLFEPKTGRIRLPKPVSLMGPGLSGSIEVASKRGMLKVVYYADFWLSINCYCLLILQAAAAAQRYARLASFRGYPFAIVCLATWIC